MSGSYRRIDSTVKMKAIGQKKGGGWGREEDQRQNLGFFQCGVGGRGANKDWEGVVRKAGRGSEDYRVPETKENNTPVGTFKWAWGQTREKNHRLNKTSVTRKGQVKHSRDKQLKSGR